MTLSLVSDQQMDNWTCVRGPKAVAVVLLGWLMSWLKATLPCKSREQTWQTETDFCGSDNSLLLEVFQESI